MKKKVKVRVHNIVKWCSTYTDENGYYKMSKSYLTNVHYTLVLGKCGEITLSGNVWINKMF